MIYTSRTGIRLSVEHKRPAEKTSTALFCLHGFACSKEEWHFPFPGAMNNTALITVDLPGFGDSSTPEDPGFYSSKTLNVLLLELLEEFGYKHNVLLGYSMGGRYALSFATEHSDKLVALILESSSPGIYDNKERMQRKAADTELINGIINGSIGEFVDFWLSLELFRTQKQLPLSTQDFIRSEKMQNSKTGLINSLKEFGTGTMKPLWDDLKGISLPVLLIAGELDKKYSAIQKRMKELMPNAACSIIAGAGHNTHIEKPVEFATLVHSFIQNLSLG